MSNYNITDFESQVKKILQKAQIKKSLNKDVISWLHSRGLDDKALAISNCANNIGITNINGVAKIVRADFCKQRLCNVCAWRRQSKFTAQMFPVLKVLQKKYEFLFVTLTMRSVPVEDLKNAVNEILKAYDRLLKHRRIKRSWVGKVRGLEMKYNQHTKTFNPHIHVLVAVENDYFTNNEKYISHKMLVEYWSESLRTDYKPRCEVKKVTDQQGAVIETLKYSFKQMNDNTAMLGFHIALSGRRLVSFSGVFAETRKLLRLSDFENVLTDDMPENTPKQIFYSLYTFDATGGVYSYYKQFEMAL